jgi:hypothetical protein
MNKVDVYYGHCGIKNTYEDFSEGDERVRKKTY